MTAGAVGRYAFAKFGKKVVFLTADYAYGHEMVRGFQAVGKTFGIENARPTSGIRSAPPTSRRCCRASSR